ncbi:hypothetical protein EON63_22385 [archaeon]|nr:MAG: hypothetical protein EON63_22385 [archaeon]
MGTYPSCAWYEYYTKNRCSAHYVYIHKRVNINTQLLHILHTTPYTLHRRNTIYHLPHTIRHTPYI